MTPVILTKEIFSKDVEDLVIRSGTDYMDAILTVAEKRNIEIEIVPRLLSDHLKIMLAGEARIEVKETTATPLEFGDADG